MQEIYSGAKSGIDYDKRQKKLRIAIECGQKAQSVEGKSTWQAWIALARPALIAETLLSWRVANLFCDDR